MFEGLNKNNKSSQNDNGEKSSQNEKIDLNSLSRETVIQSLLAEYEKICGIYTQNKIKHEIATREEVQANFKINSEKGRQLQSVKIGLKDAIEQNLMRKELIENLLNNLDNDFFKNVY
jgi:hypothetical protein